MESQPFSERNTLLLADHLGGKNGQEHRTEGFWVPLSIMEPEPTQSLLS